MSAEFVMAVGIPGCGKSKYIKNNFVGGLVVSPDNIRKELYRDVSYQENNVLVWQRAIGRIEGALYLGKRVALDATNTKFDEWSNMISKFPKCKKIAWVFHVEPCIAQARIQRDIFNRVDRANVPIEMIEKYYDNFKKTVEKLPKYFDFIKNINNS